MEENKTVETPATEQAPEPVSKMSRIEALTVGLEAATDKQQEEPAKPSRKEEPAPQQEKPKYEPPPELTAEERDIFLKSSPEQQATTLRLFKGYQERRAQLNRDLNENGWVKKLAEDVVPFLKATGEKLTPQEALAAALRLRKELEDGDPIENAARYLKRKGYEAPPELLKLKEGSAKNEDPKLLELQKTVDALKLERENEVLKVQVGEFLSDWEKFATQTNAAKQPRFPDVDNSEAGAKLAAKIGSLTNGKTEVSKQFIESVKERLPNAGRVELLTEAYKFYGGRVDDSGPVQKVATNNHLQLS